MRPGKYLTIRIIVITFVAVSYFSCSRRSDLPEDEFVQELVDEIEIDLSKINRDIVEPAEADIVLRSYRDDFKLLRDHIDSLISEYPSSYDMKAVKIQLLQSYPEELNSYINRLYSSDSLNSHHQFFYGNSLTPEEGKKFFVNMIKTRENDPYGYLGLALSYLYSDADDYLIPAKLAYLSIIKDHTVKDSYSVLSYIFDKLGRNDDQAFLNGVMLVKDPSNANAFENLFSYYVMEGQNEKGKKLLETFIKNNPESMAPASIAERYEVLGYLQEAGDYLAEARSSKEKESVLDYIEAKLCVSGGRIGEGLFLLKKYADQNLNDRNLIYRLTDELFAEKLFEEEEYRSLLKRVENKAPTIGDKAPKISGDLIGGGKFSPKIIENKVYLIDFWAQWCEPCRAEIPNITSVYSKFNSQDFEVIGINLDNLQDSIKAAQMIKDQQIEWRNIYSGDGWDDKNVSRYKVIGIPTTFLVDKNGIIRYKYIKGEDELSSRIRMLLSE